GFGRLVRDQPWFAFRASVVHGRIETAEAFHYGIDEVTHVVLEADVGANEHGLSAKLAQFGDQTSSFGLVTTRRDYAGAFPRERERRRAPDAGQRTRDENDEGSHAPFLTRCLTRR